MKKNMGGADRTIRILLAIVISILFFTNVISGTLALVLLAVSAIFILTSFVSFCPIYAVFGINTCAIKKK